MTDEAAGGDGVFARFSSYLDAHVQLVIEDGRVRSVTFPDQPDDAAAPTHPLLDRIEAYLTGTATDDFSDVALALEGPPADIAILEAVRSIPYGEARSLEAILTELPDIDDDADADARAREVLDGNPVPLLLPDHRVRAAPSGAPPRIEQRLRSLERIVT